MAVVDTGSLGRAAQQLNVTQPALSRIIKRLEARLKVQLFERHAAGMDLTTFGEALLPYASFLRTESSYAIDQINAMRGLQRGRLRVGCVGSVAVAELPGIVKRIHTKHPHLLIEIVQDLQDNLVQLLCTNNLDLIVTDEVSENAEVIQIGAHAFSDVHIVVSGPNHPIAKSKALKIRDLSKAAWILPKTDMLPRRQLDAIFNKRKLDQPNVVIECRAPSTVKSILAQNDLLGWLPYPLVSPEIAEGRLRRVRVKELEMRRDFRVYRRRRSFVSPPIYSFIQALQETVS